MNDEEILPNTYGDQFAVEIALYEKEGKRLLDVAATQMGSTFAELALKEGKTTLTNLRFIDTECPGDCGVVVDTPHRHLGWRAEIS